VVRADDLDAGFVQEGDAADHLRAEDGVRLITRHSASLRAPGFSRIWSGTPILPMSCRRKPYSSAGSAAEVGIDRARQLEGVALHPLRVLARPGVLRPEGARERGHRLLVRALEQAALRPLDLDEDGGGRGRRARAAPRRSGP
jgi:hypothetical protein